MTHKPLLTASCCAALLLCAGPVAAQIASSGTAASPIAEPSVPSVATPLEGASALSVGSGLPERHQWKPLSPAARQVVTANRAATQEPNGGAFVNAVQVYAYSDGALYHLYTAPGQVTDIALQPGEQLGAVASGDTVRWVVGDTTSGAGDTKRAHILVKPFTPGLATNLVITTDRHVYHVSLTSTVRTAMAAVSWTYPQDQLIALKKAADAVAAAAPVAAGLQVDQLHFDYTISGDQPAWRPLRAFDDGRQTFIEFPASLSVGEAPPLFLVDGKRTASLVNYRVQGRYYVVDRLFDVAELRLGFKHQDIVRISRAGEPGQHRRQS
ncbi:MAG: P-type conjugative transfer protein TrbG [Sphingomonadaceae bacterium]|nr:P-type conjugative transfer protein TrbG [Sphingomonadaceae bacterium]